MFGRRRDRTVEDLRLVEEEEVQEEEVGREEVGDGVRSRTVGRRRSRDALGREMVGGRGRVGELLSCLWRSSGEFVRSPSFLSLARDLSELERSFLADPSSLSLPGLRFCLVVGSQSRILIMVADRLVNEAYIGTPRHVETQTSLGYSHRWTLAYLQTRNSLCQIRLVGRSWREAGELASSLRRCFRFACFPRALELTSSPRVSSLPPSFLLPQSRTSHSGRRSSCSSSDSPLPENLSEPSLSPRRATGYNPSAPSAS